MTLMVLWLRSSPARWAVVVYVAITVAVMLNLGTDWRFEWAWGNRQVLFGMPLVAPLIAGCSAFDVARRWHPSLADLEVQTLRGHLAGLVPWLVNAGSGFLALVVAWVGSSVTVLLHDGVGQPDGWAVLEGLVACLAAAGVGVLLGGLTRSVAAAPVAALLVYGCWALAGPVGVRTLFTGMPTHGSLIGVNRSVVGVALTVGLNLVVALLCILALRVGKPWRLATGLAVALVLLLVSVTVARDSRPDADYVSFEPADNVVCAGRAVSVCGPLGYERLVTGTAHDLDRIALGLRGSGLTLPRRYDLADTATPASLEGLPGGVSTVPPAAVLGDGDPRGFLVSMVVTPKQCPAMFDYTPRTEQLLRDTWTVDGWLRRRLDGAAIGPAPAVVRQAHERIRTCAGER